MEIILANPKIVLANMYEILNGYKRAAKRKRGIEPYISMCCVNKNDISFRTAEEIKKDYYSKESDDQVLVTVKYPEGLPAYDTACNYAKTSLHEALWKAEWTAWNNHANFKSNPVEVTKKEFLHEKEIIKEIVKLKDLGITDLSKISDDEIYEHLWRINDRIYKSNRKVTSASVNLGVIAGRDIFYDSLGNEIIQDDSRMAFDVFAYAEADDMPEFRELNIMDKIGGFGGVETFKRLCNESSKIADEIGNKAVEFSRAKSYDGNFSLGQSDYDLILDGKVAGVSIHEVGAGHAVEATDLLREEDDESIPNPLKLGERYGIKELNIIDDGSLEVNGIKPFSWFKYDIEGVKARKTHIIKNGIFNSYLHTKLTAGSFTKENGGGVLTGNARIETADDYKPEARMSTLYIQPSKKKCSLDDLLNDVRGKGIYITGITYGETDRGQGKVGMQQVYFINNAGHKVPVRIKGHELYITESVINYMNKISKIGDKSTVTIDTGYCGSESGWIPHSACGAAIKVEKASLTPEKVKKPLKEPLIHTQRRYHFLRRNR